MQVRTIWKAVIVVLPLLVVLMLYFSKKADPLVIVDPVNGFDSNQFRIILQTDSLSGGSSSIALVKDSLHRLSYRYTLNNKVNAPLVRIMLESKYNSFFDLSPYNTLSITVKSDKGKQIPVVVCNAIPYHSTPDEVNSYQLAVQYARASPEFQQQEMNLEEFTTPDWWYAFASNKQYQNVKPDVSLAKYLFFMNTGFSKSFTGDTVTISELRFEYKYTPFFFRTGISVAVYYLFCLLLFYFPKALGVEKVYLMYKKIDTINYEETDKNKIISYLRINFQNPELSIADVQNATGIHQRKISAIIKKDAQLTFKAYLNQLRIEKAKALLSETETSISDIAIECGYNSVTHFNRVFKSELQVSPQEFRLHQKSLIL